MSHASESNARSGVVVAGEVRLYSRSMSPGQQLSQIVALRYVQPLREGGSLPAVVDTDHGLFVTKFRGAGQGARALVAELIVGMLALAAGLTVPQLAIVMIPNAFGRSEPDPEIRDLLRKSHGVNVGLRYLEGAFNFDAAAAGNLVAPDLAARIVWFDAMVTNPDRTARNTNIMVHGQRLWLIDHGAALYAHHDWPAMDEARARAPFPLIRDHVLLTLGDDPNSVDDQMAALLTDDVVRDVLDRVPDELLEAAFAATDGDTPAAARAKYFSYLTTRLRGPRLFSSVAGEARAERSREAPQHRHARR